MGGANLRDAIVHCSKVRDAGSKRHRMDPSCHKMHSSRHKARLSRHRMGLWNTPQGPPDRTCVVGAHNRNYEVGAHAHEGYPDANYRDMGVGFDRDARGNGAPVKPLHTHHYRDVGTRNHRDMSARDRGRYNRTWCSGAPEVGTRHDSDGMVVGTDYVHVVATERVHVVATGPGLGRSGAEVTSPESACREAGCGESVGISTGFCHENLGGSNDCRKKSMLMVVADWHAALV